MMKIRILLLTIAIILSSCDNKYEAKDPNDVETLNSGKLTVYCDEQIKPILDSAFILYTQEYDKVELTVEYANSRNVMSQLLSKEARVVVNARDYLSDEDSLMNAYKLEKHKRFVMAYDGLVFFTNNNFPVDTLNVDQIENAIVDGEDLSKSTVGLDFEPTFATLDQYSSVYANFNSMIVKNNPLKKKVELLDNIESL
ncbi:MAG: substrate-binding domain-containing protein, partial [Candidatus Kapaibacterium sp.]